MKQCSKNDENNDPDSEPLIQKMIIFGVKEPQKLTIQMIQRNEIKVKVLQIIQHNQYTPIQDEVDEHNYEMWAYPDGIKIYDQNLAILNDKQPENSFNCPQNQLKFEYNQMLTDSYQNKSEIRPKDYLYSYVSTDYQSNKLYCMCLCFHVSFHIYSKQKVQVQDDIYIGKTSQPSQQQNSIYQYALPKCTLWKLESSPEILAQNIHIVYVPKVIIICSNVPCFTFQKEILKFYYKNVIIQEISISNTVFVSESKTRIFQQFVNRFGYAKAQQKFNFQYEDQSDQQENIGDDFVKDIILKNKGNKIQLKANKGNKTKKYREVHKKVLKEFFTSFIFLPKLSKSYNTLEIVDLFMNNTSKKRQQFSWISCNKNLCFSYPNIKMVHIIQKIGVKNLITLWRCLILQKQILIFWHNNLQMMQLCETLFYLIEPLKWQTIYIPFLPFHLHHHIDAVQSYLIGMSQIHMQYMIHNYKVQMENIVFMDLQSNIIIEEGDRLDHLIPLPSEIQHLIQERLQLLGYSIKKYTFKLFKLHPILEDQENKDTANNYYSNGYSNAYSNGYPQPHKKNKLLLRPNHKNKAEFQKILQIKRIFFDALLYLFNNYSPFAKLCPKTRHLDFDKQAYLELFSYDQKWLRFMKQLNKTMVFIRLCEYHLDEEKKLQWNQYHIGGLFIYCQKIVSQKHKNSMFWKPPSMEDFIFCANNTNQHIKDINPPYYEYYSYVMSDNLDKIFNLKEKYYIQKYLIKFIHYKILQKQKKQAQKVNTNNKNVMKQFQVSNASIIENQQNLSSKKRSFYETLKYYIFPWLEQIQQEIEQKSSKRQDDESNYSQRSSSVLKISKPVLNLQELFIEYLQKQQKNQKKKKQYYYGSKIKGKDSEKEEKIKDMKRYTS